MNEFHTLTEQPYIQTPNIKKQLTKCYNWACGSLIFQFVFSMTVIIFSTFIYNIFLNEQAIMSNNITERIEQNNNVSKHINTAYLLAVNAVAYLIANTLSSFIANSATKKIYNAKILNKNALSIADSALCILAILGLQGLSIIVQVVIAAITGISGIDAETAEMMSFSNDIFCNIVLVTYTVFIAAITEEVLCRGTVMKLLSPVGKSFALTVSSLLFGFMHGNFNQMFNGFLLGLVLGYSAMKSKSVLLPIICHMAANAHAMILSYLEYKIGKSFFAIELIYAAILAVTGITAIVFMLKRNGRVNDKDGFPSETALEITSEKAFDLKWKLLLKTSSFWIFVAICFSLAILSLTPIADI